MTVKFKTGLVGSRRRSLLVVSLIVTFMLVLVSSLIVGMVFNSFSVTYALNGGDSDDLIVDFNEYSVGDVVHVLEAEPTRVSYVFNGWVSSFDGETYWFGDAFEMPSESVTFTADWISDEEETVDDEASLKAVVKVGNETSFRNAVDNATEPLIIALSRNIKLSAPIVIPAGKNIALTSNNNVAFFKLIGANSASTLIVDAGGRLTLDGVIVSHKSGDVGRGVIVNSGGMLNMNSGEISDNYVTADDGGGGGVYVHSGGFFELHGGVIANNTSFAGGGVYVNSEGSFVMYNGVIDSNVANGEGGGVYVFCSDFRMYGGDISGNMADGEGGGVYLSSGSFSLFGDAVISGNTAKRSGGGVYVVGASNSFSRFVIHAGGVIVNNTAHYHGGGVYVRAVSFSSSGGVIANNTAWYGGGVYMSYSSFTISNGGVVANNKASMDGGGVYVHHANSVFNLRDGRISGNTASTGGGVYNFNGTFDKSGGKIFGNTAAIGSDVHQNQ
ncbi:MAG: InlB B-repeat-containing protein [Candidatus Bathyarchaeota archaeon]|nr:InlB B-repeat-containing protein [Candidatus Termiticorpusculum sp.]